MKQAKRLLIACPLLLLCLFLGGCWSNVEINQLAIVMGIGIDKGTQEGNYQITAQLAKPSALGSGSASSNEAFVNVKQEGPSISQPLHDIIHLSSRKLYTAHNQIIVISQEVAQETVSPILDYFIRSLEGRFDVSVMVIKGAANEALAEETELEQLPAMHLKHLLESQRWISTVESETLYDFLVDTLSVGTAPTAPLAQLYEAEDGAKKVELIGTAVFVDAKMVGELDIKQTRAMQVLKNQVKSGNFFIETLDCHMSLDIGKSETSVTTEIDGDVVRVRVRLRQECAITGASHPIELADQQVVHHIEQEAAKAALEQMQDVVRAAKEMKADIFGFGENLWRHHPAQSEALIENWIDVFPNIEVEYDIEVVLSDTGTVLQPVVPKGELP